MNSTLKIIRFIAIGAIILSTSSLFGQTVDTLWTKMYSAHEYLDSSICVQETSDSGLIIFGTTLQSGEAYTDIYIIKTDADGDTMWTNIIGDTLGEDALCGVETFDNNYMLCGYIGQMGLSYFPYVVKINNTGDTLWTKQICDGFDGVANCIIETATNEYLVTGRAYRPGQFCDFFLCRINGDGIVQWTKYYGDNGYDEGIRVMELPDSTIAMAGHSDFGSGVGWEYWLVKTDSAGTVFWDQTYGGSATEWLYDAHMTTDGGFILGGNAQSFVPYRYYAVKTDSVGDTLWTSAYNPYDAGSGSYGRGICPTSDGGYLMGGYTYVTGYARDYCFFKMDANGDSLWTFTVGGGDYDHGHYVMETSDGNYLMIGKAESFLPGHKIYLVKIGDISVNVGGSGINVLPDKFELGNNYPNPFNPSTVFSYTIPKKSHVVISIYNILGQKINTIVNETKSVGTYTVTWDGTDVDDKLVSTGIYFYQIRTENFVETRKMVLMK